MKPMFGPKRFGIGISPRGWRGYGLTFGVAAISIAAARLLQTHHLFLLIFELALWAAFLIIGCLTYSKNA